MIPDIGSLALEALVVVLAMMGVSVGVSVGGVVDETIVGVECALEVVSGIVASEVVEIGVETLSVMGMRVGEDEEEEKGGGGGTLVGVICTPVLVAIETAV